MARKRPAAQTPPTTAQRIASLEKYLAAFREGLDERVAEIARDLRVIADTIEREDAWIKRPGYTPFDSYMSVEGRRIESLLSSAIQGFSNLRLYRLPMTLDRIRGAQAQLGKLRAEETQLG